MCIQKSTTFTQTTLNFSNKQSCKNLQFTENTKLVLIKAKMFLWFSKTSFLTWIVCIHKDAKLGTKKVFPRSAKWDLNFSNYEMACRHTDLLLIISLSLIKDLLLLGQSKVGIFTCLYNDLSPHTKTVTYRTLLSAVFATNAPSANLNTMPCRPSWLVQQSNKFQKA